MARISQLFVTHLYRDELAGDGTLLKDVAAACRDVTENDRAGHAWAEANRYPGYTSYASLNDLPERDPAFADLVATLDRHVARFAKTLDFDLADKALELDSLWINVLRPGGHHGSHIHPHSAISGTFYVAVPKGAGAIKFEDPRLGFMMAAPLRKAGAKEHNQTFVTAAPEPGTLLLWESWLRHEVPVNAGRSERCSVSFNYRLS